MDVINFKGHSYPHFQTQGNAAKFAIPYAKQVCSGEGLDIGCNRHEWCFPEAKPIDPLINNIYDAYCLPAGEFDYIFSSHCLEHLPDWVKALDYWETKIKAGGTLFLYLPHPSQQYWRPYHNRKHIHVLYPELIKDYLETRGWRNIFVSKEDLNNSFMAMAEKA